MGSVIAGLSMSLDGFVVGRGDGPAHPLGEGGGRVPRSICGEPCPTQGRAGRPPGPGRLADHGRILVG